MHKIKNKNTPHTFLKLFNVSCHANLNNFSLINFSVPGTFLITTHFAVLVRGPILLNNCLSKTKTEIDNSLLFKQKAKELFHLVVCRGRIYRGQGNPCRRVFNKDAYQQLCCYQASAWGVPLLVWQVSLVPFSLGILSWYSLWGTALDSSWIINTLYCKCKYNGLMIRQ